MDDKEIEILKKEVNDYIDYLNEKYDDESLDKLKKISRIFKDSSSKDSEKLDKVNKSLSFFQRVKESFESNVDIDPGRLMGLCDGIFGMVMTLLVFGMALPEIELLTYGDFLNFLISIGPTFGVTIVSFILVGSFWIYHHEFIKLKGLNLPYLWLNVFFLACISFIPFSTSIIGTYSEFFLAEVMFGINILLTIVMFLVLYQYAYNKDFLAEKPSRKEKKHVFNTFLFILALTVVVNLLDFNISSNFIYLFLLVPVISTVSDIRFKMNMENFNKD